MSKHKTFAYVTRTIQRDGLSKAASRMVPEEVPIAFSYGGTTQAVMMASPSDLEDFAIGFSLSERIIQTLTDIEQIEVIDAGEGLDIQIRLKEKVQDAFSAKKRATAGPVGCGLCGIESIEDALHVLPTNYQSESFKISANLVTKAVAELDKNQQMRAETGAVHAAGFMSENGDMVLVREDVGRHNALDKLIGARARLLAENSKARDGFIIMTSRVSVDLIQKVVIADIPILVAVSTPTALAIRTAEQAGLTLIALARKDGFEVYTHPHRILPTDDNTGENSDVA